MNTRHLDMMSAPIPKLLLKLAIPTVVAMLVSSLYNLADTYFVSSLGDSPSAAISVVFSLMSLIQAVGFSIGMGAGSLISRHLGKKDENGAYKHASQAVMVGVILGVLFLVFGYIFRGGIVRLLGATDSAAPYAKEYMLWIILAAPFMMLSFILNNILRAEGKAMLSMMGIGIGGLLNIGLDPLFIHVVQLGIAGAGIATMISQIVSFLTLASFFVFRCSSIRLHPRYISKDYRSYWNGFACGAPTLVRQGFTTSSNIIVSFLAKPFGDPVVAALGITAKIYMVVRNIIIGLGQGYQPVLGYNYGAKNFNRIKKAFWFTLALQTGVCLLASSVVLTIPGPLIQLFRDSIEVIEIGTFSIRFLAISLPFLGFSTIVNQSLQVMGYAKSASFLASCRQGIVFTPIAFLFSTLWADMGLCLAQPISDLLTAFITVPFFLYMFRVILKDEVK